LSAEDANPYAEVFNPRLCPNCKESYIPDSKFCKHCRMVLTYDAFQDTIAEQQKKDDRLATMEEQVKALIEFQQKIVNLKTKTPEHELREAKALIKYNKIENDFVKAGLLKEEDKAVLRKNHSASEEFKADWNSTEF
jgi:predicted amidophosphoribosyltransferase